MTNENLFFKRIHFVLKDISIIVKLRSLKSLRQYEKDTGGWHLWK